MGSVMETEMRSEMPRKARMTARKAVTGVTLLNSVICGYTLLVGSVRVEREAYEVHRLSKEKDEVLVSNLARVREEVVGQCYVEDGYGSNDREGRY